MRAWCCVCGVVFVLAGRMCGKKRVKGRKKAGIKKACVCELEGILCKKSCVRDKDFVCGFVRSFACCVYVLILCVCGIL